MYGWVDTDKHQGIYMAGITCICLSVYNSLLKHFQYGPQTVITDEYLFWKWRNHMVSFTHSLVSAFWGLLALFLEPRLALDMMDSYSEMSYFALCFSNGYFVYDIQLSILNLSYKGRLEIIVHHILTISCLSFSTYHKQFIGYCMIALVVEISNIFLHIRQLLLLLGLSASKTYRINSVITIMSLIIMRLFPLSWIVFCLYMENDSMGYIYWLLSTFCAVVIIAFSVFLVIQVTIKDFVRNKRI